MKSFSRIVFGCLLLILSSGLQAQCCDPDMSDFNPAFCAGVFSDENCINDEPVDCTGTINPACIPLDGGLSLLAIAGGGLATAAMRRRREDELLEKEA